MQEISVKRPTWRAALEKDGFLPLPAAHDAMTARLIEQSGFHAYQIGGFGLVGAIHAVPDIDLEHFGEISQMVGNIVAASTLPVLVDCDDGYGDAKNVTRTVIGYQVLGASAIFMEDQQAPKRCGHMAGKSVIPVEQMVKKVKAAVDAKNDPDFFILARTDAIAPHGLDDALMRGEQYLKAGADGLYFEGPTSVEQLAQIGRSFQGVPLATSVLELGGKTPNLGQKEFKHLGFSMVLYPSTMIFQVAFATRRALENLKADKPASRRSSLNMEEFEEVMNLGYWKEIEKKFVD